MCDRTYSEKEMKCCMYKTITLEKEEEKRGGKQEMHIWKTYLNAV